MGAHLEPVVYIVRGGQLFTAPPDKAECSGTVTIDEDGVATIRGLAGNLNRQVTADITRALNLAGYRDVRFKRRKNGKWRTVRVKPVT